MNSVRIMAYFSIATLLLLGCSSTQKPSQSEIRDSLAASLPTYLQVKEFSIEASQSAGTQVQPLYQTRFKATLALTTGTFEPDGIATLQDGSPNPDGTLFIKSVKKEGDQFEVYGQSLSQLYAGGWKTQVTLEGFSFDLGKPRSTFSAKRTVVRGGSEESDYAAELEKNLNNANTLLIGTWEEPNNTVTYLPDGTFHSVYPRGSDAGKTSGTGTFKIEGRTITLSGERYWMMGTNTFVDSYRIVAISPTNYVFGTVDDHVVHATRAQ